MSDPTIYWADDIQQSSEPYDPHTNMLYEGPGPGGVDDRYHNKILSKWITSHSNVRTESDDDSSSYEVDEDEEGHCLLRPEAEKRCSEVRINILLHIPDLPALHSIVHASPVMHSQYLSDRHRILSTCLDRDLDYSYRHAYAHLMSTTREIRPLESDLGYNPLRSYGFSRQGWFNFQPTPSPRFLSPGKVRVMAACHLSVVWPLLRQFRDSVESNLGEAAKELSAKHPSIRIASPKWTSVEDRRTFCALYDYGTFHNLFGRRELVYGTLNWEPDRMEREESVGIMLQLFDYGLREMSSIEFFFQQKYTEIFDIVQRLQRNRCLDDHNCHYCDTTYIDLSESERVGHMHTVLSGGLKLLASLSKTGDRRRLASKLSKYLDPPHEIFDAPLAECLYGEGIYTSPTSSWELGWPIWKKKTWKKAGGDLIMSEYQEKGPLMTYTEST
ncbi:hypothetical protein GGS20DRAFT_593960 [Poronia punctata]|nr:hypothetical protein GGS20DRAFT_593960 [Poronia punctata]